MFDERSAAPANLSPYSTLAFDIDLGHTETVQRVRHLLAGLKPHPRLVFAVDRGPRRHQQTVQANALGASNIGLRPFGLEALLALVEAAPAAAADGSREQARGRRLDRGA